MNYTLRKLTSLYGVLEDFLRAILQMVLEPWHVLGGGALGKLWSARLGRSVKLLLKEKAWSALELLRTATIDVHEKFNSNHLRRARVHVECARAKGPINRLLVGLI